MLDSITYLIRNWSEEDHSAKSLRLTSNYLEFNCIVRLTLSCNYTHFTVHPNLSENRVTEFINLYLY